MERAEKNVGESSVDGRGRSPGSRRTWFRPGPDPNRAVRKRQPSGRVPWLVKALRRILDRPESKDRTPAERTCRRLLKETLAGWEKAIAHAARPKPSLSDPCRHGHRFFSCGTCEDALHAWEAEQRAWGVTPSVPSPENYSKPVASPPPGRESGRPPRRWQTPLTKTPLTPADRAAIEARIRDAYDWSGND
jgi:hypothetical protein